MRSPATAPPSAPLIAAVATAWVLFLGVLWVTREAYEGVLAPLGVIPIVLTGWAFGPRGGLAGGLFVVAASVGLHAVHGDGDPALQHAQQNAFRWLAGIGLGYGTGVLVRALRRQRDATAALRAAIEARGAAERELARSEKQFRTLAANFPDYITRVDREGRRVYSNPATQALWEAIGAGKPDGTKVGEVTITSPAASKELRDALSASLADGRRRTLRQTVELPSGRRHLDGTIVPEKDADGKVESALIVARDVTETREAHEALKRSSDALRASEERFRMAARATLDVIYDLDVPAGRSFWGDAMVTTFGHDAVRMAQDPGAWAALVHPDDLARVQGSFGRALADGSAQWQEEYRFRHADGSWRRVLDRCLLVRGADGKATRAVGSMADVTAVKQTEEDLRASQARWRSLAENAPSHILTCDLDGRITSINRAVPGIDRSEVVGRLVWDLAMPGTDVEAYRRRILDVARTGEPCAMEGPGPGPDGTVRWYATNWAAIQEDGRVTGIISLSTDITEIRQAQQEREASRLAAEAAAAEQRRLHAMAEFRSQFLNNAAHELATPLTPLKLQLATLKASPLAKQDPAAFDLLERNIARLGNLVNDLLDAARLQSGHFRMRPAPVAVPDLLGRVAATFKAQAREAGVTLGVKPLGGRLVVACDEMRIEQVLYNLVHNALKFTRRGGQVWLDAGVDGQFATLEVRDTGIGLTPQQAEALFQPFIQVHDAANLKAGGTGLGLYIARGIAQQHGGTLTVASRGPNEGAVFTLRLPLTPAGDAASSAPGTVAAPPRAAGGPGAPRPGP